jgi:hypothetical protein
MEHSRDPNSPIDNMMPPEDNPEYHRRKAEHLKKVRGAAEQEILSDPTHAAMADRISSVRQGPPAASAPTPMPPVDVPPVTPPASSTQEQTGITIDPTQGQVTHSPVEGRLPEGAAPIPAVQNPAPATPIPDLANPILMQLREDFGIDKIPLEDVTINGHVFAMRVLEVGAVTTALRLVDTISITERESAINLQIALVSFSVMGIDGEPLYRVFDVAIPHDQMVMVEGVMRPKFAPMAPPSDIRTLAATKFMEFLGTTASASVLSELWKQYGETVDPKGTLERLMAVVEAGEEEQAENLPLP